MKVCEPPAPTEWRFVQDLHAVNAAVHARAPAVPNPCMILSQTPAKTKWFTFVDLSNAYFSIPVHLDSQYWFALMFDGQPYTNLCRGSRESPTIYPSALFTSLAPLQLTIGTMLLQYVDDLLIAAPIWRTMPHWFYHTPETSGCCLLSFKISILSLSWLISFQAEERLSTKQTASS